MSFEVTGTLHAVFPEQQIKTLRKREFVLRYADNPEYPQLVKFEMTNDRIAQLDNYQPGDEVTVSFRLRGRAWTNPQGIQQYFNSLEAWRLQVGGAAPQQQNSGNRGGNYKPAQAAPPNPTPTAADMPEPDDLPF